ncbi:hypothetical protein ASD11_01285 [Aeromicrobium sp. Root495]|uniref:hypothetical protein n=1 Tax=Aeromicrobium sp. Root495 TaxID=1736550 RepID=UPI0006FF25BF|nr:hypothetical protein [Aeromicrobium sp. Root495]KQY58328.1 hypothetical protein ASD11_01285 [Aeromicrobium sp. Root495]
MTTAEHERCKAGLKARSVAAGYPPHVGFGELLVQLDEVTTADRDRLREIERNAAYWYTASALWAKLPADQPGDRSPRATAHRRHHAEIAEQLWLAANVALSKLIHSAS